MTWCGRVPWSLLLEIRNCCRFLWASLIAQLVKNLPVGDLGSILGSGRSSEGGNGNPLQYSCLENSMDSEAWRVRVHGVAESDTTE